MFEYELTRSEAQRSDAKMMGNGTRPRRMAARAVRTSPCDPSQLNTQKMPTSTSASTSTMSSASTRRWHARRLSCFLIIACCATLFEPALHFVRYQASLKDSLSTADGYDYDLPSPIHRPQQDSVPTRNGMVPRSKLRNKFILDSDPLMPDVGIEDGDALSSDDASSPQPDHPSDVLTPTQTHARIVYLQPNEDDKLQHTATRVMELQAPQHNETGRVRERRPFERHFYDECEPIAQLQLRPSCNGLHEFALQDGYAVPSGVNATATATTSATTPTDATKSMAAMKEAEKFIATSDAEASASLLSLRGSWRSTWRMERRRSMQSLSTADSQTGNAGSHDDNPIVMKMLHLHRRFDEESFQNNNLDAMVMERLTASPYVVTAYGYCGQSILTEWAPTGGREHIKQTSLRPKERLKIARDLARGLADLHALRYVRTYTAEEYRKSQRSLQHGQVFRLFAHNDINVANTVQIKGRVKWNDFNIGELQRHAPSRSGSNAHKQNATHEHCLAPVRYRSDLWRSPEEIRNSTSVDLEKTDVYGLGNILFQVLTKHQPWMQMANTTQTLNVTTQKLAGHMPDVPEKYRNSTRAEVHAMLFSTMSCFRPQPESRPSAMELAYKLGKVYEWLKTGRPPAKKVRDLFTK